MFDPFGRNSAAIGENRPHEEIAQLMQFASDCNL